MKPLPLCNSFNDMFIKFNIDFIPPYNMTKYSIILQLHYVPSRLFCMQAPILSLL